ncbi:MAG: glycoside hydrolase N-terminal domain-containing protein [Phycisphaerae bacterium]|nr:glycoside hydrolase N-terminal domain-containing protein [Phycisphaerae bacterium]
MRTLISILLSLLIVGSASASELSIWSGKPAGKWIEAYPIGNGGFGAMIFGGVEKERIQFNHDTLFNGQPHDYAHKGAARHLAAIRKLLFEGKQAEAHEYANREFMSVRDDGSNRQRAYQPFGEMILTFNQFEGKTVENYRRELDIDNAVASLKFDVDGTTYTREVFASFPDNVIVTRFEASKNGAINCIASLSSPHDNIKYWTEPSGLIIMAGQVKAGVTKFEARLKIRLEGGKATPKDGAIEITGADKVTLILAGDSSVINYKDVSGNPTLKNTITLKKIENKLYGIIKADHIQDYRALFGRVSLDVGTSEKAKMPTAERLKDFDATDPQLVELFFQYGRYLMIACSRPGSQPANLQGLWNDSVSPPWDSKYTCNINTEMNYWPAEMTNLAECHEPLFSALQDLSVTGDNVAKEHYGARGWVVHHNFDLWRGAAPINNANHGIWVVGGAWMCQHLWWHYDFGRDKEYLKNTAYPLMKNAAIFFVDYLIEDPRNDKGWLISGPSNSPENQGLVMGPTMDHQVIRNLFANVIEASRILNVDEDLRNQLIAMRKRIAPNQIGKYGQLQEWLEDKDDPKSKHRHVSHLWGLHPGNEIHPLTTPDLANACKVTLAQRGDGGTGWSKAWKINFWARLLDGDHSFKMLAEALRGNTYPNLFDAHPPFQIDGNFGATSGITEMLLQSHLGEIHLLPALPSALPNGSVKGLRARGGFEVDINWAEGQLISATIHSHAGTECIVRYNAKTLNLNMEAGATVDMTEKDIALNGVTGNIFNVSQSDKCFDLLKETVFDPKTNEGKSRHTVYWTDKTIITKVITQVNFKGIAGPVITKFHPLDPVKARPAAEGKPFATRFATVLPESKKATGLSKDGKSFTGWFTLDTKSRRLRGGTVKADGKAIKASLLRGDSKVYIQTDSRAEELSKGFWKTTIQGNDVDGKFVLDRMEIYPLVDPRTVDDPKLPRVLVIGDSISMNYHEAAKAALAGKANYYRCEGNGGPSDRGLSSMELWLGDYTQKGLHWDVIQFNHGLHDLKQAYDKATDTWGAHQVSIEEYMKNLEREIQIMKKTGATLIWCATTPVPNSNPGQYARRKGEAAVFNKAALEVIRKHLEIQVNDLHKFISESRAFDSWRQGTDVHFWSKDLQALAGNAVADAITKALPTPPNPKR